jgi:hypothetical protein
VYLNTRASLGSKCRGYSGVSERLQKGRLITSNCHSVHFYWNVVSKFQNPSNSAWRVVIFVQKIPNYKYP